MKERKHFDEKEITFNLSADLAVFKSIIEIKGDRLTVDFTKEKTFKTLLGFNSKLLTKGNHKSDNKVQMSASASILIKCSIIGGSYHKGKLSNVLYTLPNYMVPVGYKINIFPPTMIYLPIINSVISEITFEITDDLGIFFNYKKWY